MIIENSNSIKDNNILDDRNKINKIIYNKLSKIKEKVIVLDSKLAIHVIEGNDDWINDRNTILTLSIASHAIL